MNKETKAVPYPLVTRSENSPETIIRVRGVVIGGDSFTVMAGPCAVESEAQLGSISASVKKAGAQILRGGAYKPRTSPYSFQGLESEGLKYLQNVSKELDMPVVSEIMDARQIPEMMETVDIFQVGARNMQNFTLLKELGKIKKPILLKRGMGSKIDELLGAAEYILNGGNKEVIICERGIRTFEDATRSTLDISAVPILKRMTHLPVIVDPSHAAGRKDIVPALSLAACAAGADGIIVEIHNNPKEALCDGSQALSPQDLENLIGKLKQIVAVVGKKLS